MSEEALSQVVVENDQLLELRERLRKHEKPSHIGLRTLLFVGSLAAFIWFMRESGPMVVAMVVAVLAFHEAGHLVAMKLLGYENMSVFFVPFMGAAVSGRARKPGGWRAAIVSLAGPVPGILLAALILATQPTAPVLRVAVVTLVYLNALNLLPFVPLDGGRLMNTILFSRNRHLEIGGTVVGMIGLFAVPDLLPGTPGIWAGVFVSMLLHRSRMIEATSRLRKGDYLFDGPTSALPEPALWALHGEANRVLEKTISSQRNHTSTMAMLHDESATRPASWPHSLGLFAVWAGALALAWFTWDGFKHPKANWQQTVGPASRWSVSFPFAPKTTTTPRPAPGLAETTQVITNSSLGEFGVTSFVLEDEEFKFEQNPGEADVRLRAMVTETARAAGYKVVSQTSTETVGMPALKVTYQPPGLPPPLQILYIASGNAVYMVSTTGVSAADEATFRESFQLLRR